MVTRFAKHAAESFNFNVFAQILLDVKMLDLAGVFKDRSNNSVVHSD
jgi:hypothetical protein